MIGEHYIETEKTKNYLWLEKFVGYENSFISVFVWAQLGRPAAAAAVVPWSRAVSREEIQRCLIFGAALLLSFHVFPDTLNHRPPGRWSWQL